MPHSGPFFYSRIERFDVTEQKDILLAFQERLLPETARPTPSSESSEHRLEVSVVFTSAPATIAALRKAGALAENLAARITLIAPQVVPYPLPLESPPVLIDFSERRFRQIADESPVDTTVRIYLCRDRMATLKSVLAPHSLVVIGGPKRRWPTREKALARQLRRAGHEVVFTETGVGNSDADLWQAESAAACPWRIAKLACPWRIDRIKRRSEFGTSLDSVGATGTNPD